MGPNGAHPNGAHPNGAHPNSAHPNGAHPNGAHPNGAHPNSAHSNGAPCSTKCPFKLHTLTVPTLMVHLVAPNVLLNKHLHAVMSEVPGKKKIEKIEKKMLRNRFHESSGFVSR